MSLLLKQFVATCLISLTFGSSAVFAQGPDNSGGGGFSGRGFGGRDFGNRDSGGSPDGGGRGWGGGGFPGGGFQGGGFPGGSGGFPGGGFQGGGFPSGGPSSDGGGFNRGRSTDDMMQRLDPNNSGMIEFDKLQDGRTKFYAMRAAQEAGLDITKPISAAKIKEMMENRMKNPVGPPTPGSSSSSSSSNDKNHSGEINTHSNAKLDKEKEKSKLSLVPGFGLPAEAASIPGFGEALALTTTAHADSFKSDKDKSDRSKDKDPAANGPPSDNPDDKVHKYAMSLMKQYDANKNGTLERDEWKNMRGEPEKADTNHDGIITLDELVEHLKKINPESDSSNGGGFKKDRSASTASFKQQPKRSLTPADRLPEGLPSWFAKADIDGDGQITMAEFSSVWNDAKVAEFMKYDLNGDGVITAAEVLKVERPTDKPSDKPIDKSADRRQFGRQ